MKKIMLFVLFSLIFSPVWAEEPQEALLNKVTLQLHAERWIRSQTALVSVTINAAVTDSGLEKIQNSVLQKLNTLSNAQWHIVSYGRQQDKSGLESIQMSAEARLAQVSLAGIRDKAKELSKPGETFTIDSVSFTPSDDEIRQANSALRLDLYQQAKVEIEILNKLYPNQAYYLHHLDFTNNVIMPVPMNSMAFSRVASAPISEANTLPLAVGNKQELRATVVIASMPNFTSQKIVH